MMILMVFLFAEVLIFSYISFKNIQFIPIIFKLTGALIYSFFVFSILSKISHYNATLEIDRTIFKHLTITDISIFRLSVIANTGVFIYALSAVSFIIITHRKYMAAAAISVSAILICLFNTPAVRESLYIYASTAGSGIINLENTTRAVNSINSIYLMFVTIVPYIYLFLSYTNEPYVYRRKKLLFSASIHLANDIVLITLFLISDLKSYFFTNYSLIYYPFSTKIVHINNLTMFICFFAILFTIVCTNFFVPFKKLFRKNNELHNLIIDENVQMTMHTYKNAFSSICQYSDKEQLLPITDREKLDVIYKVASQQIDIIEDSLEALNSTTMRMKKNQITSVKRCLQAAAEQSKISPDTKLIYNFFNSVDFVYANHAQLQECFLCIFNNAAEALHDTENKVISATTEKIGKEIYIEIRDNGPGIKNKRLVFKPMYSTKMGGSNFGIGLTYTKKLIQALDGDISIKSRLKEFTAIQIMLPLYKERKDHNEKNQDTRSG